MKAVVTIDGAHISLELSADDAKDRAAIDALWTKMDRRPFRLDEISSLGGLTLRWQAREAIDRERLAGDIVPMVGQRVVTVREVAESWRMPHAHDDLVHEITSLRCAPLIGCGPTQYGASMLAIAPDGSEVTCPSCRGWHTQMEKSRIDSEVFRRTQLDTDKLTTDLKATKHELVIARAGQDRIKLLEELVRQAIAHCTRNDTFHGLAFAELLHVESGL